jgi:hypothetical protein
LRRLIAATLLVVACASPGMPPGGPPDVAAPQIIAIVPDSGRVGVTPREVIFRFDEVVNERPQSVTNLADLFLISPRDGAPRVSWNRDEIAVRPRGNWRPNTAYTVTMMRGLSDIRGNVRNAGASTFFSTGPTVPETRITGQVFDWVTADPAAGALLEAYVPPDSVRAWVAVSDTAGRFSLERIPPGRYVVRAMIDRNKNRGIDSGEPWDSATVTLTDNAAVELLAFAHDTVAPRVRDVNVIDSLSIRLSFDRPIDPRQQLTPANFAVIGRDSAAVGIAGVTAGRDTIVAAGRADTLAPPRPTMSRPRPVTEVVLRFDRPLTPAASYRIRAIGLRGLLGHVGDSERAYTSPAPTTPPMTDSVTIRATPPTSAPPVRR